MTNSPYQNLSENDYQRLVADAEVIEADGHGEKVLQLRDGCYLKLFRRKRLLSSALWKPYGLRFAENAVKLRDLKINAPDIIGVFKIPHLNREGVYYKPVQGRTLKQIVESKDCPDSLLSGAANFIVRLHQLGVYFRSLHLANIVYCPENGFGLIDFADLKIKASPLPNRLRARNLAHLERVKRTSNEALVFQRLLANAVRRLSFLRL